MFFANLFALPDDQMGVLMFIGGDTFLKILPTMFRHGFPPRTPNHPYQIDLSGSVPIDSVASETTASVRRTIFLEDVSATRTASNRTWRLGWLTSKIPMNLLTLYRV